MVIMCTAMNFWQVSMFGHFHECKRLLSATIRVYRRHVIGAPHIFLLVVVHVLTRLGYYL